MKVKDLLKAMHEFAIKYGEDFAEYDVYTEQCSEYDKRYKRESDWEAFTDPEDWEYFKCEGFNSILPDKKIFTINVNY
jgi:hypothetical protein